MRRDGYFKGKVIRLGLFGEMPAVVHRVYPRSLVVRYLLDGPGSRVIQQRLPM